MDMNSNKCVYIKKSVIDETLNTSYSESPVKKLLEPLRALSLEGKVPLNILEDVNVNNEAEIHKHEADLWLCLDGEVTFIYGGEMVDPWVKKNADGSTDDREWKAKEIKGGTEVVLKPGDWLWIPAGEPHQHKTTGKARLAIIKVPKV
jgi:beta-galactosidase beta subunit